MNPLVFVFEKKNENGIGRWSVIHFRNPTKMPNIVVFLILFVFSKIDGSYIGPIKR